MMFRLAWRSLLTRPIRTLVLAGGFGAGIAVMASLLGVAEVVLEQSRAPALAGGGDVIVTGAAGRLTSARYVLSGVLGATGTADRVVAASPRSRKSVYLVENGITTRLRARGGIPSLERILEDPETARIDAWRDTPADTAWISPDPAGVLRGLDRFHPIPDVPARADSWSEWLYFNGQADTTRFYLTLLVGPTQADGRRVAGVRLQLDRDGELASYGERADIDAATVLATAPELTIGSTRVRIEDSRYRVTFDLPALGIAGGGGQARPGVSSIGPDRARGTVILTARRGGALPPFEITGAGGWVSGYVVPVMSGELDGTITVGTGEVNSGDVNWDNVSLAGGTGYHDHNWGFWEGVSWQWGQVHHDGLSILYGRVFPPSEAADASRVPGFLMVLGPDGPLGQATDVTIEETNEPGTDRPRRIVVHGTSSSLDVRLDIAIENALRTAASAGPLGDGLDLLQLRARYNVSGRAGERSLQFTAAGAAETFRGR